MNDEQEQKEPVVEQEAEIDNITHIDDKRIDRLRTKAPYLQIVDSFDLLRVKLLYGEPMTGEEGVQLVTLTKYMMKYGHNEQIKIMAKHLHDKYMKKHGL